jgi:ABC-type sulfate/molybdate transport systems ATPase subunit
VQGEALFDHALRIDVPAHRRRIGYVPQHHSLFPFGDVFENVAFGLPRSERRRDNARIRGLLEELGLGHLGRARPESLSGGERQRVALARALAVGPRLLLLDEPFASIDREGRAALRSVLRESLDRHGIPAVFVTHDLEEALAIGDRLTLFERGRTTRTGKPAALLGSAESLVVEGRLASPACDLGEGMSEVTLERATLRGPLPPLVEGPDGTVRVSIPTRPAKPYG